MHAISTTDWIVNVGVAALFPIHKSAVNIFMYIKGSAQSKMKRSGLAEWRDIKQKTRPLSRVVQLETLVRWLVMPKLHDPALHIFIVCSGAV